MLKYITMSLDKIAPVRKFKFRNERPIWFSDELMVNHQRQGYPYAESTLY